MIIIIQDGQQDAHRQTHQWINFELKTELKKSKLLYKKSQVKRTVHHAFFILKDTWWGWGNCWYSPLQSGQSCTSLQIYFHVVPHQDFCYFTFWSKSKPRYSNSTLEGVATLPLLYLYHFQGEFFGSNRWSLSGFIKNLLKLLETVEYRC